MSEEDNHREITPEEVIDALREVHRRIAEQGYLDASDIRHINSMTLQK